MDLFTSLASTGGLLDHCTSLTTGVVSSLFYAYLTYKDFHPDFVSSFVCTCSNNSFITRFRQVTGILLYIATKSNVSKWWGNDSSPGVIAFKIRSIPRITSTISVPPDVIHHSSVIIPIRVHSSRHNALNTGLIPTNTALITLAFPSEVVPQDAVIPLNAGSCLCSLA